MRKRNACFLLLAAAALAVLLAACGNSASIRLARTEGSVSVWDEKEAAVTPAEDLGLYAGYRMATEASGYSWLSLDEKRLAKLDELSAVGVESAGKS